MSDTCLELSNAQARHIWLERQGLACPPDGQRRIAATADRVGELGMTQLDSIGVLARAHHHILWSRQSTYRPRHYDQLLGRRLVFEHFTHDAAILPMHLYPYWRRQQRRRAKYYAHRVWTAAQDSDDLQRALLSHIERQGPTCSRDLVAFRQGRGKPRGKDWHRPPHKHCLDYLWLAGVLAVSHREDFHKYYDLAERVIPAELAQQHIDDQSQVDHLCESALYRLGFANAGEIQRFWDACDLSEVQAWLAAPSQPTIRVRYSDWRGEAHDAYALAQLEPLLSACRKPTGRLRLLNPFDPLIRDRQRLQRLFGFDYRIEIYVPADQRRYGYYVCPLLEGDRLVGRIDARACRDSDSIQIRAWWLEAGIRETPSRRAALLRELSRFARLVGVSGPGELPEASPSPMVSPR